MEWKKIENPELVRAVIPKDKDFLGLWKGTISLCHYCTEENKIFIGFLPAETYGFWPLSREREGKITHFCELLFPSDY